ncbi:MAG TPA: hypothetical protein PLU88_01450 [Armatimonadota bacterium]|nr:hypothetical protein [Armatimonadota bacterium]
MWTLYDPLTRTARAETQKANKPKSTACPTHGRRAPSTAQRLWFLLEPTSPLTSRHGLKNRIT